MLNIAPTQHGGLDPIQHWVRRLSDIAGDLSRPPAQPKADRPVIF